MKNELLIILGCFTVLGLTGASIFPARYDDFRVYRVNIRDEQELSDLQKVVENFALSILSDVKGPGHNHDILVHPINHRRVENILQSLKFHFDCIIQDLQSLLEEEATNSVADDFYTLSNRPHIQMNWTHYQHLPVINNWLDKLQAKNPFIIESYVIGYSYENRPIKAIKISYKHGNKAIFIESNIHAIEWISSATTTCFINSLLNSSDKSMKLLLENYDWIFVPILNPDGFVYSHDVNRLWRKNRKPTGFHNSSGPCYGTDMNRNFDYEWGVNAYNFDVPCDHWYAGNQSNTEPEVLALENFVNTFEAGYIRMYLAFHSYGNYILLPYGHSTTEFPSNYDQMMSIAAAFADAAKVKYGTKFKYGASGVINYPVSGSSKDWAYGVKKIPFTATLELRDSGHYGFFLPRSQILEVCEEVSDGLKAMVAKAQEEGLFD